MSNDHGDTADYRYACQSRWRRFLHRFGVATYVDAEGGCIYCGGWH